MLKALVFQNGTRGALSMGLIREVGTFGEHKGGSVHGLM